MSKRVSVAGVDLELIERGEGPPLLFLHAGEGLWPDRPWLELLAKRYRVIAPFHPGYGTSALPDWFGSVDDLAYLYLDLAASLGLEDATLVGSCLGGWIAAEMAVRSTARFSRLVLVDPLGIKVGGRNDRDIADMHAMPRADYLKLAWADPAKGEVDFTRLPETELAAIVRGREAFALYGWKPYMHNPRLRRWLHRIDRPTLLLWGAEDRIVTPAYGEGWAKRDRGRQARGDPESRPFPALGAARSIRPAAGGLRLTPRPSQNTARRENSMRVWYFSEMAYHPAWDAGLQRGSLRVVLPSAELRSAGRPRTAQPLSRRVRLCRCVRPRHHGQRASQHRHLPDHLGADGIGHHRPRDQERAPALARQPDRQPARSGARRRGDGLARRPVGWAHRARPRQGCALRDRAGQQQPGAPHAPLLGSARPHHQGDVDHRRSLQLGRRVFPLPQRQHLAAPAADSRRRRSG